MANVYIDFSAANDGDGTSPAQAAGGGAVGAFNTIVGKTFANGDLVWFRRAGTLTLGANLTLNTTGVSYIGWPISTDIDFAARPAAGQSGGAANWDADSTAVLPLIASATTQTVTTATATGQFFRRLKFDLGTGGFTVNGNSPEFRYCTITSSLTGTTPSLNFAVLVVGSGPIFYNCTLDNKSTGRTFSNTGGIGSLYDCVITHTVTPATTPVVFLNGTILFVRCTFTDAVTTGLVRWFDIRALQCYMYDCTVSLTGYTSVSNGGTGLAFDGAGVGITNTFIRNMSYTGPAISIASGIVVDIHFSRFTQTCSCNSYAWQLNQAGFIRIAASNVAFAVGNVSGDINFMPTGPINNITSQHCEVVLNNAVFRHSTTPINGNPFPGVWSNDHNGVLGAWFYQGARGTVVSTNANRTGGEAFSLKYTQADPTIPTWVPPDTCLPGFDTQFVDLVAGVNTVTLYGAYKTALYPTPPTQEDVWLEVEYLDQGSGAHRAATSSKIGGAVALTSDSSVWNNDTALTAFKIVLSITAGQACKAPVRYRFNKFQTGAYTLIDPKVVVS